MAFGTSEYARLADASAGGPMAGVPIISAERVQVRYRWSEELPREVSYLRA